MFVVIKSCVFCFRIRQNFNKKRSSSIPFCEPKNGTGIKQEPAPEHIDWKPVSPELYHQDSFEKISATLKLKQLTKWQQT